MNNTQNIKHKTQNTKYPQWIFFIVFQRNMFVVVAGGDTDKIDCIFYNMKIRY